MKSPSFMLLWAVVPALGLFFSCGSLFVQKPYDLDLKKCPPSDLFPPELTREKLAGRSPGNVNFLGVQEAHRVCHNAERDAIQENQKRVIQNGELAESPLWRQTKDVFAAIGAALVAGAAVYAGAHAAPLLVVLKVLAL